MDLQLQLFRLHFASIRAPKDPTSPDCITDFLRPCCSAGGSWKRPGGLGDGLPHDPLGHLTVVPQPGPSRPPVLPIGSSAHGPFGP